MKLSVIIPCKNEVGVMEDLLDSLVAQETAPNEVIVIDSHSTDTTAKVAKSYESKLPIRVLRAKEKGLSPARNEGAMAATGELLLFIDADVTLPRHFIKQLLSQTKKRDLAVGGFSQRMVSDRGSLRASARVMNGYVKLMSITPWPIFFSCFFATKAVHQQIHGFDKDLWIMEDYDYAYRAKKSGAKFGLIHGTYFKASSRRFAEGASSDVFKGIYAELYRYTHGLRITKPLYQYEMGGKKKKLPK